MPRLMRCLPGPHQTVFDNVDKGNTFIRKKIEEHQETFDPSAPRDFIWVPKMSSSGLEKKNPTTEFHYDNMWSTVFGVMLGGLENIPRTLTYTFSTLMQHPQIQEQIQKEIDDVIGRERSPCEEDRKSLPLTNAFIHEVLRTLVPMTARYTMQDVTFRSFRIPKSALRDEEHWATPLTFNPQHFLDEEGNFKDNSAFLQAHGLWLWAELAWITGPWSVSHVVHKVSHSVPCEDRRGQTGMNPCQGLCHAEEEGQEEEQGEEQGEEQEEEQGEEQEEVTGLVCRQSDLRDGQMKEVTVGEQEVLLVRVQGRYSAVGSKCSHYNAPLVKGALVGDRVRCPFHGACFNIRTGDIEEFPGLDSLPTYKVRVEDGNVYVSIKKTSLKVTRRVREMCSVAPDIDHTVLLVGGGPASLICAETLRQNCYRGRIVMVTKDALPPFDKPKLSKAMHLDSSDIVLRSGDFFQQYGIEVWTHKEAVSVNPRDKAVTLSDGASQRYDQLLVSTGCRARPLGCPGWDLKGVKLLQTYEDAREIHSSCRGRSIVIVGASFIGMEVASYLSDKAARVAVVGAAGFPYERALGPEIGKMTMQMLEERNVRFYMNDRVTELRGENGNVKEVLLRSGAVLEADVVIAGVGVIPNSDFLTGSQVEVDHQKAVIVDEFMRTNVPDVFAAGDVTSFPLAIRGDQRVNIGHWQMSQAHGRVAALNMLKKPTKIKSVPFFWTVLLGKSIRYTGYGEGYTEIIFKGSVAERKFLAFYIKDEAVVAAASLMFDPAVARLAELMAAGQIVTKAQAQDDDLSWLQM